METQDPLKEGALTAWRTGHTHHHATTMVIHTLTHYPTIHSGSPSVWAARIPGLPVLFADPSRLAQINNGHQQLGRPHPGFKVFLFTGPKLVFEVIWAIPRQPFCLILFFYCLDSFLFSSVCILHICTPGLGFEDCMLSGAPQHIPFVSVSGPWTWTAGPEYCQTAYLLIR